MSLSNLHSLENQQTNASTINSLSYYWGINQQSTSNFDQFNAATNQSVIQQSTNNQFNGLFQQFSTSNLQIGQDLLTTTNDSINNNFSWVLMPQTSSFNDPYRQQNSYDAQKLNNNSNLLSNQY